MRRLSPLALVLTLNAGVASAGQGWYLLTPNLYLNVSDAAWRRIHPELNNPHGNPDVIEMWWVNLKAPLSEWYKAEAFDSARECEEYRRYVKHTGTLGPFQRGDLALVPGGFGAGTKLGPLGLAIYRNAVCVAADDPRLK